MAVKKNSVLFVLVLYSCYNTSFCYLAEKMNKISAERFCSNHGGLVSYERFLSKNLSAEETLVNPLDGQSAWINGYVTFSKFVSFHSCFSINFTIQQQYKVDDNGIFSCLHRCNRSGSFELIGVNYLSCYCINYADLINNVTQKLSDNDCGIMVGTNNSGATNTLNVAVYKIETYEYLSGEAQQCVCVKKINESLWQYGTDLCYNGHHKSINGYMCANRLDDVSDLCQPYYKDTSSPGYCLKSISLDWYDAFSECHQYNGTLATSTKPNMKDNKLYWTGVFRDFQIVSPPQNSSLNNTCVSIRKVADTFYFDPDDCSIDKVPLCNDDIVTVQPSLNVVITSVLTVSVVIVVLCVVFFQCRTCEFYSVQRRIKKFKTRLLRSHDNDMSAAKTPDKLVTQELSNEVCQYTSPIYSVAKDVVEGVCETTQYASPDEVAPCTILKENAYDKIGQKEAKEGTAVKKTSTINIYSHTNCTDASSNSTYDVIGKRAIKQANRH